MARTKGQRASAAAASKARTEVRRMIPHFEDAGNGPEVKIGPATAPVYPLLLMGIGGYLMWFGIHYWRSDVKWPSDPVKALLQGKGIPAGSTATPQSAYLAAYTGSSPGTPPASTAAAASGDAGAALQSAQQNQDTAQLLAASYGWSQAQNDTEWNALLKLWNQESGWDNLARNPSSGAFGIAQALGHGQQGTAGKYGNEYPSKAANDGDATAQIEWGLGYIQGRYGDPVAAWQHEQQFNWY